ncbi:lipopolysaccharide core heptose(II)-phosphate phosphatase PmrG [Pseudomonas putida]
MLHDVVARNEGPLPSKRYRWPSFKTLAISLGVLLILLMMSLWLSSRVQVAAFANEAELRSSGVYAAWVKGDVVVLVRHAERCDRSPSACLDDPSGITVQGSQAAANVGNGLHRLGLEASDILSSPQVRTQQTARFMFGKAVETQEWLNLCDSNFSENAFSHKRPARNLILVTHSGCIDHLERQLNVAGGERSSAYTSALFVYTGGKGKPQILGQMDSDKWKHIVSDAGK